MKTKKQEIYDPLQSQLQTIVAIDFGTTNTVVTRHDGELTSIIYNTETKSPTTPTLVGFDGDEFVFGESVKTLYGSGKRFPFLKNELGRNEQRYFIKDRDYFSRELIILFFQYLYKQVKLNLKDEIFQVILTIPAYFTDDKKQMLTWCAQQAGFKNIIRTIAEPSAAAIYYDAQEQIKNGKILVYDFGGGTLDVSVLDINGGHISALPTTGNANLGGVAFDQVICRDMIKTIDKYAPNINWLTPRKKQELMVLAEEIKIKLSYQENAEIVIPNVIYNDATKLKEDFLYKQSRINLEEMCGSLIDNAIEPIIQVLQQNNLTPDDIDAVIVIGGSSNIPKIKEEVARVLNHNVLNFSQPEAAVALGAAMFGSKDVKEGEFLLEKVNRSYGFVKVEYPNQPLDERVVVKLLERGQPIPCEAKYTFIPNKDYVSEVLVFIVQGESLFAGKCDVVAPIIINDLPMKPKGSYRIVLKITIDKKGLTTIKTWNTVTNKEVIHTTFKSRNYSDVEMMHFIEKSKQLLEEPGDISLQKVITAANKTLANILFYQQKATKTQVDSAILNQMLEIQDALKKAVIEKDRVKMTKCMNEYRMLKTNSFDVFTQLDLKK